MKDMCMYVYVCVCGCMYVCVYVPVCVCVRKYARIFLSGSRFYSWLSLSIAWLAQEEKQIVEN